MFYEATIMYTTSSYLVPSSFKVVDLKMEKGNLDGFPLDLIVLFMDGLTLGSSVMSGIIVQVMGPLMSINEFRSQLMKDD